MGNHPATQQAMLAPSGVFSASRQPDTAKAEGTGKPPAPPTRRPDRPAADEKHIYSLCQDIPYAVPKNKGLLAGRERIGQAKGCHKAKLRAIEPQDIV